MLSCLGGGIGHGRPPALAERVPASPRDCWKGRDGGVTGGWRRGLGVVIMGIRVQ